MQTATLISAYNRTHLAQHGISFEAAMQSEMFKTCLTRVAEAIEKPQQPAAKWLPYKD